jgi:molybdate transport system ATP-binding protein
MTVEVRIQHGFRGGFLLDAEFAMPKAGVTALFGPSGAGKTTIVNAIAGVFRPLEGRITFGDRVMFDSARGEDVPPSRRHVGYVFQDARLFPHMSVRDNLLFGWRRAGTKAGPDEIAHIIALLGLDRLLDRRPRNLSGGEKQRVALGRALLSSPEVLLLDEPLASLDAQRRAEILPYLERLRDEARIPLLFVSHALDEVSRLADQIVVVRNGRVTLQGSVFDILTRLELPDIAGAPPVGAVIAAMVEPPREDGLVPLSFDTGILYVSRLARPAGTRVRVRIKAEEIMLALEEPKAISANNVLPVRILAVSGGDPVDVQLVSGSTRFVARVTRASCARLDLRPGRSIFAIIKSVTVDASL